MSIFVGDGFRITSALPADLKSVWESTASLYTTSAYPGGYISSSWRYEGMTIYCKDDNSTYKLINGLTDNDWIKIMTGSLYVSASHALNGGGSGVVSGGSYNISSSWASQSLSASYAPFNQIPQISCSWSSQSLSASWSPSQPSSTAISASWASSSLSASYAPSTPSISSSYVSGSQSVIGTLSSSFLYANGATGLTVTGDAAIGGLASGVAQQTTTKIGYGLSKTADYAFSVVIGYQAAFNAGVDEGSVQIGYQAGINSTSDALNNVQIGYQAGGNSTNARTATQIGFQAGLSSPNAQGAVQIGASAGGSSTTATNAVQVGFEAGLNAPTCTEATQVGNRAGSGTITNGNYVVQLGSYAGYGCDTATNAVQIGHQAAYTGVDSTNAVQIGYGVGYNASKAVGTIQIGMDAGRDATTSTNAVIIGTEAGKSSTNASQSVQIGYRAGYIADQAEKATFIGSLADTLTSGLNISKSIGIGYNAKVSASNTCIIGGTGIDAVKVGIATYDPQATLHVMGNISASSVTASLFGTASYVISSSYALSSSYSNTSSFTTDLLGEWYVTASLPKTIGKYIDLGSFTVFNITFPPEFSHGTHNYLISVIIDNYSSYVSKTYIVTSPATYYYSSPGWPENIWKTIHPISSTGAGHYIGDTWIDFELEGMVSLGTDPFGQTLYLRARRSGNESTNDETLYVKIINMGRRRTIFNYTGSNSTGSSVAVGDWPSAFVDQTYNILSVSGSLNVSSSITSLSISCSTITASNIITTNTPSPNSVMIATGSLYIYSGSIWRQIIVDGNGLSLL